jgi:antitoxin component YwqK of YwqJK toxin-antitoxin module
MRDILKKNKILKRIFNMGKDIKKEQLRKLLSDPTNILCRDGIWISGFYGEGLKIEYWEDLTTIGRTSNWKGGRRQGEGITYYEDGQIESEGLWKNGNCDGVHVSYYGDGIPGGRGSTFIQKAYEDGLRNGEFKKYTRKGKLNMHVMFKDSRIVDDFLHPGRQYNDNWNPIRTKKKV